MKKNNYLFPIKEVGQVAEKESWRKEINRPIYHIHKWWAQRLGSVFRALLIYLAEEGEGDVWDEFYNKKDYRELTVFDPFMGSGTTLGEAVKLGMKAIGCDINPVSFFLVKQELTRVSIDSLKNEYNRIEKSVSGVIKKYYETIDDETGDKATVLYYFWVKCVLTPDGEEIPLFSKYVFSQNAYPSKKPEAQILCPECWNVFSGKYNQTKCTCPKCKSTFNPQKGPANNTTVIDKNGKKYKIKELIPQAGSLIKEKMYALMLIDKNGKKKYQSIKQYDIDVYSKVKTELGKMVEILPEYPVKEGYNTEQARGYNYLNWKDFFNSRQLLCLNLLLDSILKIDDKDIREQFLCLFSSTLEFNNMFCSFKGEGTGAVRPIFSNHILKPERTPLENSVWGTSSSSGCFSTLFSSRLIKAKQYLDEPFELFLDETKGTTVKKISSNPMYPQICFDWENFNRQDKGVLLFNADSSNLSIPDCSVDYVVTDPPYFDFIHYSELSDFFYAWLGPILKSNYEEFTRNTSRRKNEVQQTDSELFSLLLGNVFGEANRILKPEGKMAFSFHHSRAEGWIAIAKALINSGFYLEEVFPIHAEAMATTPKSSAKEPISLDAMIICSKINTSFTDNKIKKSISFFIKEMIDSKKSLSCNDIFVISASQCLCKIVNDRLKEEKALSCIEMMKEYAEAELQKYEKKEQ